MATLPDLASLDAGLPSNIDAEKTILGAILLDNAAHAEAAERLEPDDFSLDSHKRIFMIGMRLWPPARTLDSGCSISASKTPSRSAGAR